MQKVSRWIPSKTQDFTVKGASFGLKLSDTDSSVNLEAIAEPSSINIKQHRGRVVDARAIT
jgi:hypothetical protein